ncbi:hypothetical protein ACWEPA_25375 [Streptomyces filamentosus]
MLEQLLARQERYIREQAQAHDTDAFIDRLTDRIARESARPARIGYMVTEAVCHGVTAGVGYSVLETAAPATSTAVLQVPSPSPGPEPATRHPRGSTRPVQGRRRRRPTPLVTADPRASKAAVIAYVQTLCERVLRSKDADEIADFATTYSEIGARAFACFLYQADRLEAALYWWRFAAGMGDPLSAHLLAAHHAAADQVTDARAWKATADLLGFNENHLPLPARQAAGPGGPAAGSTVWNVPGMGCFVLSHHIPEALIR